MQCWFSLKINYVFYRSDCFFQSQCSLNITDTCCWKNIKIYKIFQNLKQDYPKPKGVQYCTYMFLCINHLHSEEKSYLAMLFGKFVPSPSSLQHNGFILKFSLLMSLDISCTPLATHTALDGYFKFHPHAC